MAKAREILASIDSRHIGVTDRGATTLRNHALTAFSGDVYEIASTDYQLDQEDNGKVLLFTAPFETLIHLPPDVLEGFNCLCIQYGAGKVSVAADAGAVVHNRSGYYGTAGLYAGMSVLVVRQNDERTAAEYLVMGDVL